jgi:molybdopterin molybdotransferase
MEPHDDVRMRGFRSRVPVADVLGRIRAHAAPLPAETIPLDQTPGRILAVDVHAPIDVPGFPRAAVDGYAVRGEDTFAASEQGPIPLEIIGDSQPARPSNLVLQPGQAVRISTGAPIPPGADAVLQAELASERPGGRQLLVLGPVAPARHIGQIGEDIARGALILRAGRLLRPQDAGLLASLGLAHASVIRRPRLALLSTGDELIAPGGAPGPYQIVDSNALTLSHLARRDHADPLPALIARDGAAPLKSALDRLLDPQRPDPPDLLLVTGATSVGQHDLMPLLLRERGHLWVHGVAIRPASPTALGVLPDGRLVFLLPGNPVSALCAYEYFVGPYLRALGARPDPWTWPHPTLCLPLARKLVSKIGRTDFVRVQIRGQGPQAAVYPLETAGASLLSSVVYADGVVNVPPDSEGHPAGARVQVYLF